MDLGLLGIIHSHSDSTFEGNILSITLEEALLLCEIEPDGRQHDGLDDAINTAKIIEKLKNHPEYQLMEEAKSSCDLEKEPLNFSLGSLFANLDLHIA